MKILYGFCVTEKSISIDLIAIESGSKCKYSSRNIIQNRGVLVETSSNDPSLWANPVKSVDQPALIGCCGQVMIMVEYSCKCALK